MIKCLKNLLSAVLSFSLIFTPLYAYSQLQESSESSRPEELIQWMAGQSVNEPLPKEFQEASRIFKEMGDSLEKGVFKEYLEDHPQLVDHFDILSLRNQTAGIVNEISGEIKSSIDFNVYTHQSYPTIIKNIEVDFPEGSACTHIWRCDCTRRFREAKRNRCGAYFQRYKKTGCD